jgi:hypothetical protein
VTQPKTEYGGWLFDCGHFHPAEFVQVAKQRGDCIDCKLAKAILKEAEELRKKNVSAPPAWHIKGSGWSGDFITALTKAR